MILILNKFVSRETFCPLDAACVQRAKLMKKSKAITSYTEYEYLCDMVKN